MKIIEIKESNLSTSEKYNFNSYNRIGLYLNTNNHGLIELFLVRNDIVIYMGTDLIDLIEDL